MSARDDPCSSNPNHCNEAPHRTMIRMRLSRTTETTSDRFLEWSTVCERGLTSASRARGDPDVTAPDAPGAIFRDEVQPAAIVREPDRPVFVRRVERDVDRRAEAVGGRGAVCAPDVEAACAARAIGREED